MPQGPILGFLVASKESYFGGTDVLLERAESLGAAAWKFDGGHSEVQPETVVEAVGRLLEWPA